MTKYYYVSSGKYNPPDWQDYPFKSPLLDNLFSFPDDGDTLGAFEFFHLSFPPAKTGSWLLQPLRRSSDLPCGRRHRESHYSNWTACRSAGPCEIFRTRSESRDLPRPVPLRQRKKKLNGSRRFRRDIANVSGRDPALRVFCHSGNPARLAAAAGETRLLPTPETISRWPCWRESLSPKRPCLGLSLTRWHGFPLNVIECHRCIFFQQGSMHGTATGVFSCPITLCSGSRRRLPAERWRCWNLEMYQPQFLQIVSIRRSRENGFLRHLTQSKRIRALYLRAISACFPT